MSAEPMLETKENSQAFRVPSGGYWTTFIVDAGKRPWENFCYAFIVRRPRQRTPLSFKVNTLVTMNYNAPMNNCVQNQSKWVKQNDANSTNNVQYMERFLPHIKYWIFSFNNFLLSHVCVHSEVPSMSWFSFCFFTFFLVFFSDYSLLLLASSCSSTSPPSESCFLRSGHYCQFCLNHSIPRSIFNCYILLIIEYCSNNFLCPHCTMRSLMPTVPIILTL
jgi:hypothetical protein